MRAMAKIDLPYVQAFKDRHGRQRYYYRRGRARVALPDVGDPDFMRAYAAAKAVDHSKDKGERLKPYSISALLAEYYGAAEFKKLESSTKSTYRNMLERFRAKYGDRSAVAIQTRHLDGIFESMSDTPGAAKNLRKRLNRVFRRAVKLGWRTDNPIHATDAPDLRSDGFTPWSVADKTKFETRWPSGTRERLAYALLRHTLVRRSDVVTLGRQHREGGKLRIRQQKTGREILIPIAAELATELDLAGPGMTYLLTQYGAPFSPAGFTQWFRERAEMAGLEGRTPHGLRKAGAKQLAEAGGTTHEVAAMTGHASLSEVQRYTKGADQERLAASAMRKLRGKR